MANSINPTSIVYSLFDENQLIVKDKEKITFISDIESESTKSVEPISENEKCDVSKMMSAACKNTNLQELECLISKDPKIINNLFFKIVIEKDFLEGFKLLSDKSVNFDPNALIDSRDTLLTFAVKKSSKKIIAELLLRDDIDVNKTNKLGVTALFESLSLNNDITLKLLEDSRVDPNKPIESNEYPIIKTFFHRNDKIFNEFIKHKKIDLSPLLNSFKENPRKILSKKIKILKKFHPEIIKNWFKNNPEHHFANLVSCGNHKQVNEILENVWKGKDFLNFPKLFESEFKTSNYLRDNHREKLISWLIENQRLKSMSFEEQAIILYEIHPTAREYFSISSEKYIILAYKGIELIINYLRKKESLSHNLPISICLDKREFTKEFKKLVIRDDIKDGYIHSFIVINYNINEDKRGGHVTPLFFKKENEGWKIIITDSIASSEIDPRCNSLINILKDFDSTVCYLSKIYVNIFLRQNDKVSCSTFAIRDLIYLNMHVEQILKYLENRPAKDKVVYFKELPPNFIKLTQSLTTIEAYKNQYSNLDLIPTKKNSSNVETLGENVFRHVKLIKEGSSVKQNFHAEDRTLKYRKIIFDKLIADLENEMHLNDAFI